MWASVAPVEAVVYQWESGKRRPSPVFWLRIERLERITPTKNWKLSPRTAVDFGLPECLVRPVVLCGHVIVQCQQLLGTARRAEHTPGQPSHAPTRPVAT